MSVWRSNPGRAARAAAHTVGDGARTIVWDSLREGLIDIRHLGPTMRLLTIVGVGVLLAAVGAILGGEWLRLGQTLEPLTTDTALRATSIPAPVVPLTVAAVALAWSYLLTGALYARPAARWVVLAAYVLLGQGLNSVLLASPAWHPAVAALMAALVIAFVALPRLRPPVGLAFAVVLAISGGLTLVTFQAGVAWHLASGGYRASTIASQLVFSVLLLAPPLWYLAGAELANAGATVGGWAERSARRLPWAGYLLVFLLVYRLAAEANALRESWPASLDVGALAGAGLVAAGIGAIWAWRRRQPADQSLPGWAVPMLVLAFALPTALPNIVGNWLYGVAVGLFATDLSVTAEANRRFSALQASLTVVNAYMTPFLAVAGALLAAVAARRGRPTLAAFGAVLAWGQAVGWLAILDGPLAELRLDYAQIDLLLLLALAGVAGWLAARRELTPARAARLLGLAVLGWVLHQTEFLDNPFAPLLGGNALALLVVGLLWGVLTAGGRFANADSPGFPQVSRILLYLGYVMLALSAAVWYTLSHNFEDQLQQSSSSATGFTVFGLALFYLALVEAGAPRAEGEGSAR